MFTVCAALSVFAVVVVGIRWWLHKPRRFW